jgi:hypothetical protein
MTPGSQRTVSITVSRARSAATNWVNEVAAEWPGFEGAFLHGSINWLAENAILAATSDVDVIVVESGKTHSNPGKFLHEGVLLDVSVLPVDLVASAEEVLGVSHLAGSLRGASVLADPTGHLRNIQQQVDRDFAKREWVLRRCEHAQSKILTFLGSIDPTRPFHDNVTSWLFGTGVTTHVLLVAGLRNPTVRSRYVAVQNLLAERGRLDVHEELLDLLGSSHLTRPQVEHHLATMTLAFDAAKSVIKTPVFFATDLSDVARPIAIDGTREMIERGYHREAMFWIAATHSRCQHVFTADAPPELGDQFAPGYEAMLGDLGITSFEDLIARRNEVRKYLPRLMVIANEIIAADREISFRTKP